MLLSFNISNLKHYFENPKNLGCGPTVTPPAYTPIISTSFNVLEPSVKDAGGLWDLIIKKDPRLAHCEEQKGLSFEVRPGDEKIIYTGGLYSCSGSILLVETPNGFVKGCITHFHGYYDGRHADFIEHAAKKIPEITDPYSRITFLSAIIPERLDKRQHVGKYEPYKDFDSLSDFFFSGVDELSKKRAKKILLPYGQSARNGDLVLHVPKDRKDIAVNSCGWFSGKLNDVSFINDDDYEKSRYNGFERQDEIAFLMCTNSPRYKYPQY